MADGLSVISAVFPYAVCSGGLMLPLRLCDRILQVGVAEFTAVELVDRDAVIPSISLSSVASGVWAVFGFFWSADDMSSFPLLVIGIGKLH